MRRHLVPGEPSQFGSDDHPRKQRDPGRGKYQGDRESQRLGDRQPIGPSGCGESGDGTPVFRDIPSNSVMNVDAVTPVLHLDPEPEQRQGEGRDGEREKNPGCRFLVVEDGENAKQPDLHPREVIQPIVKQLLLVHRMLPHPVDFIGGKRLAGDRDRRRIVRHCYCTIWRSDRNLVRIEQISLDFQSFQEKLIVMVCDRGFWWYHTLDPPPRPAPQGGRESDASGSAVFSGPLPPCGEGLGWGVRRTTRKLDHTYCYVSWIPRTPPFARAVLVRLAYMRMISSAENPGSGESCSPVAAA